MIRSVHNYSYMCTCMCELDNLCAVLHAVCVYVRVYVGHERVQWLYTTVVGVCALHCSRVRGRDSCVCSADRFCNKHKHVFFLFPRTTSVLCSVFQPNTQKH